ncbi:unnamed protein product, partial [Symbiodinium microadriaticum]
ARITTFPLQDPENCLYSTDVISFARDIGLYPQDAANEDFSFSDVYDAVTFSGARYVCISMYQSNLADHPKDSFPFFAIVYYYNTSFCDARVWSFFGDIMGKEWADQYEDYALGYNLTNRMPLWVKPPQKITLKDTMKHMRNHYEGTSLDMGGEEFSDVGASFSYTPVRAHPLTWTSGCKEYLNERPIATQQTGWNFVAQSRKWMPAELSGLLWFGVDDSATTVRFPVYGSVKRVPAAFAGAGAQDGVTPPLMTFDMQSAFSVFNLVANWAYSRWDLMYPDVLARIEQYEDTFITMAEDMDVQALTVMENAGADA